MAKRTQAGSSPRLIVVGAGVIGGCCARFLAQCGARVVVVEP
ncbi:MAG: NAD-binding protein [Bryobacteraceae bacterium]